MISEHLFFAAKQAKKTLDESKNIELKPYGGVSDSAEEQLNHSKDSKYYCQETEISLITFI